MGEPASADAPHETTPVKPLVPHAPLSFAPLPPLPPDPDDGDPELQAATTNESDTTSKTRIDETVHETREGRQKEDLRTANGARTY